MPEPITSEPVTPEPVETPPVEADDETLGDAGKAALVKERQTAKAEKKRADELEVRIREFEDRDKSDAQKLEDRATAAEARAALLESDSLRRDVAEEKGLTPAQAKRLVGATRDELEADADDILETFPTAAPPAPRFGDAGQGYRGETVTGPRAQFADLLNQARRR